jgi:precorrin-2 C(20)-methyltransferase
MFFMFRSEDFVSFKFYAVSTGPSGPDFITLGAVRAVSRARAVFYPVTGSGGGESHIAFDCVREAVDLSGKKCVPVRFSMTRDGKRTELEYEGLSRMVASELAFGDVAFVSIGDVSVYSTAARISSLVASLGFECVFVPGVASFSAAACACTMDLASAGREIRIVPGDASFESGALQSFIADADAKVIMKSPRHLSKIVALVVSSGLSSRAALVQKAGGEGQRIFSGDELSRLPSPLEDSYMSVLLIKSL